MPYWLRAFTLSTPEGRTTPLNNFVLNSSFFFFFFFWVDDDTICIYIGPQFDLLTSHYRDVVFEESTFTGRTEYVLFFFVPHGKRQRSVTVFIMAQHNQEKLLRLQTGLSKCRSFIWPELSWGSVKVVRELFLITWKYFCSVLINDQTEEYAFTFLVDLGRRCLYVWWSTTLECNYTNWQNKC